MTTEDPTVTPVITPSITPAITPEVAASKPEWLVRMEALEAQIHSLSEVAVAALKKEAPVVEAEAKALLSSVEAGLKTNLPGLTAYVEKEESKAVTFVESLLTLPVIGYIRRNWILLVIVAVLGWLALNEVVWAAAGWFVYPPVLCFGAGALAVLFRNVFNSKTTDAYADNRQPEAGNYTSDFNGLPAIHKVWITVIQTLVYVLVFGIISALCAMK